MQKDYRTSHLEKGRDYDLDLAAGDFNTYMAWAERRVLESKLPGYFPGGIPRYLDFACGTGRVISTVAPMAHVSFGLDVSESMVAEAVLKCPQAQYIISDITAGPVDVEPVDCVTSFRFFGNAEDELRNAVLAGLRSVLKPDGLLVINNHRNPGSLEERFLRLGGQQRATDLTHAKLRGLLDAHGYEIMKTIGIGAWAFHHRIMARPFDSALRHLEFVSRLPGVAPWCPDSVLFARRR